VGCYFGMTTKGGTQGVGRSTTQAVVVASVFIIVVDLIVTRAMIGIFGR
jgi:phospholipid/cholesterol/gamma-HCH transport system permease protein